HREHDLCFKRAADLARCPRDFERFIDGVTNLNQVFPEFRQLRIDVFLIRQGEVCQQDAGLAASELLGHVLPNVFCQMRRYRHEQADENLQDLVENGLRRTSARRVGGIRIQSVLDDVEIETGQINHTEVLQELIELEELIAVEVFYDLCSHYLKLVQNVRV